MEIIHLSKVFNSISQKIKKREFESLNNSDEEIIKSEVNFVISNRDRLKVLIKDSFNISTMTFNDIEYFLGELEAYLHYHEYAHSLSGAVLIEILNEKSYPEVETILKGFEDVNNRYFWPVIHCFPYIFSEYNLKATFVAHFFYNIGNKIKEDMASGNFFKAVDNYGYNFPDEALKIFQIYLQENFNEVQLVLSSILIGAIRAAIRTRDINIDIRKEENDLLNSNKDRFRIVYYKSWITTYYREASSFEEIIDIVQNCFNGNETEKDESLYILFRVIAKDKEDDIIPSNALTWLQKSIDSNIPAEAKFHIVNSLHWIATFGKSEFVSREEERIKSIFSKIFPIDPKFLGIWKKVEELLGSLSRIDENCFKNFLDILIENSSDSFLKLLEEDNLDFFNYGLSQQLFSSIFTKYLFSEKTYERETAFGLFKKINEISLAIMDATPSEDILNIVLLEFSKNVLLAQGTSKFLLMVEPFYRNVSESLRTAFVREMVFQAVSYPGECLDKWKNIENKSELLTEIIQNATLYFDKLEEVRDLPARSFHFFEFVEGAKLENKMQSRTLNSKIKEKSVFLSLMKHTQILYGDSWSFQNRVGENPPQKFNELRYSVEYPRMESIDPEGMALKRIYILSNLKK